MRRRTVLLGLGGVALSPLLARAQAPVEDPDSLFVDDAEPPAPNVVRTKSLDKYPLWWKQPAPPAAQWAPADKALDTAHLPQGSSTRPLEIDAAAFRRALAFSGIDETMLGPRVLFGLRAGALLDAQAFAGDATLRPSFTLQEAVPDHFDLGCVIGVWDRQSDSFWVSPGSTICNVAYLFGQAKAGRADKFCNMLSAGVYEYAVGVHNNGKKTRQPGAFILQSRVGIVRSFDEPLGFSTADSWEWRGPDVRDNIHPAYVLPEGHPRFSSAGCQVVPGTVDAATRSKPTGAWRQFRIAAGLKPDPDIIVPKPDKPMWVKTSEDGQRFSYVLLSAREVLLAAENRVSDPALLKLRRGAAGERVKRLQEALSLTADGMFGRETQQAIVNRQKILSAWADGVVTPLRLQELDLPALW